MALFALSEMLTILAIIIAPLLAVQVQKYLEIFRELRLRKQKIFQSLMATRAAKASPEHVQALNMIDIELYGSKIFQIRFQSQNERRVIDRWNLYLDHLNQKIDDKTVAAWGEKREDLFTNLLYEMSI